MISYKKNAKTRRHKIAMANALSMAVSAKRANMYEDRPEGTYKGLHGVTLVRLKFMGDEYYSSRSIESYTRHVGSGGDYG